MKSVCTGKTQIATMKAYPITLLCVLLSSACSRNSSGNSMIPAGLQAMMTGKWTINTVTLYYFDSTGAPFGNGKFVDVVPSGYYYQFNSNSTWTEMLSDSLSVNGMGGTYSISGDSSFTLVNPAAPSPEICGMDTLNASTFVFHHSRGTHYNGVTPGYVRYLFHMTRGN
jgi:hypothetical protein